MASCIRDDELRDLRRGFARALLLYRSKFAEHLTPSDDLAVRVVGLGVRMLGTQPESRSSARSKQLAAVGAISLLDQLHSLGDTLHEAALRELGAKVLEELRLSGALQEPLERFQVRRELRGIQSALDRVRLFANGEAVSPSNDPEQDSGEKEGGLK